MSSGSRGSLVSVLTVILNVIWYATAVLIGLAVCLLLVTPWVDPPRVEVGLAFPVTFTADAAVPAVSAPEIGVEKAVLEKLTGSLRFSPRDRGIIATTGMLVILFLSLALWAIGQLREVFRTLRDGHPFLPANATRIRRVAYAVLLTEVSRTVLLFVGSRYTMRHFVAPGLQFRLQFDVDAVAILSGLIILAIAEAFREGARLEHEQSLTV